MPPEQKSTGKIHIYLCIDGEEKEINPIPVWCGTSDAESLLPKLEPIEATCKFLWKRFMNNKKARLRKQQIMRSIPKKTDARCYLKWLEAHTTDSATQMPFSWMAYWYRRLEHENIRS